MRSSQSSGPLSNPLGGLSPARLRFEGSHANEPSPVGVGFLLEELTDSREEVAEWITILGLPPRGGGSLFLNRTELGLRSGSLIAKARLLDLVSISEFNCR